MGLETGYSAGYSYEYFGGNATYCIIPKIAIDKGCVLPYEGSYYGNASLAEPMSCILGAFHASYHTKQYVYEHEMGIREHGNMALLGCAGPMGIGAIDYAVNGPCRPGLVVVVDIDENRLSRAEELIPIEKAKANGVTLIYVNVKGLDAKEELMSISKGAGYDDVFVFAAHAGLVECGDDILRNDGCLNFFAGPTQNDFKVPFNFYNVHYEGTHIVGTSGGSTGDMMESLDLSSKGSINPSYMITHVGGLNAAPDTILHLPEIPGGKKIIYPHIQMELTAIADFEKLGETNELFAGLSAICKRYQNVWNEEAEKYLLSYHGVNDR
jgi:threonine dehydrogenase-like Zn-dependent dehydrogenase